jgi:hypothetical protein
MANAAAHEQPINVCFQGKCGLRRTNGFFTG